ncbi:MAG: WD40 repeat domain-containing protein, partial [Streptosporangiaceae bacterium]
GDIFGGGGTVRVWRLADGAPAGEPLTGHRGAVTAVAVGALADGAPVIISGSGDIFGGGGTVRVWRLADGTAVGEPLTGHDSLVTAVAVGALPDGIPVIVSGGAGGGAGGTVRVWRLADGTPLVPPLDLPESVRAVAVQSNVIITAVGTDIAVHQPVLP